jgi:Flp pilus assembly protein TadD
MSRPPAAIAPAAIAPATVAPAAIAELERAIARTGGHAAAFYELGGLKLRAGDARGAIAAYRHCIGLAPEHAGAYNNLGSALLMAGDAAGAVQPLEAALRLQPKYLRALTNLGKALRELGRFAAALERLEEALAVDPNYVPALVNLGDALLAAGDGIAAERTLRRCVELAPRLAEAHMSLGMCHLQRGALSEGLARLRTAVELAPGNGDAHSNLAHGLFITGDWPAAWTHFEHRFTRPTRRVAIDPPEGIARWDGSLSPELELWLVGEQGLGDQLQFARYARVFAERGVSCTLACHPRLVAILSHADLGGARVLPLEDAHASADPAARWLPLMSAPCLHRTAPDSVPGARGYLRADERRIEQFRARLPPGGPPRVALAWSGNPRMETGRYTGRSPPLAALAPLMETDAAFVSLQCGPGEEQLDQVSFGHRILRLPGLDRGSAAFLDSAAVLKCVDLLLTSDTALVHLGGALGVPTWLCLMQEPDWRWMSAGAHTPWYDSVRLFRQPARGDWTSVFREAAVALRRHRR